MKAILVITMPNWHETASSGIISIDALNPESIKNELYETVELFFGGVKPRAVAVEYALKRGCEEGLPVIFWGAFGDPRVIQESAAVLGGMTSEDPVELGR